MSQGQNVLLLYPHQLYAVEVLPKDVDQVMLIEDPLLFGRDPQYPLYLHKQKLVLLRASMRRYVEEVLWPAGYQVDYVEFYHMNETGDIVNKLTHSARVEYFDPTDDILQRRLQSSLNNLEHKPLVRELESPNFYLSREEIKQFFRKKDKANFTDFYLWQRERFNILINPKTYKPVGGKLSFENEHRKRFPKDHRLSGFEVFGSNKFVEEAKAYVKHHFPDNPGSFEDFPWPTNHDEAQKWLEEFLENRLEDFNTYEDAIDGKAAWSHHSALSPILNIGLLSPIEVVNRTLELQREKEISLASVESFVQQILGWREFVRGVYIEHHTTLRTSNVFEHSRHLTNDWYVGTTGLPPVDDVIKKTLSRGYAHNVERLMVVGNAMFLSSIRPNEVYRWFMEMFVDAYDWVVVPNVYGISQFADGGSIVAKPYVSSSNFILSMSWYERGDWCDVWDGLYWNFIERNRDRFAHNAHMRMAVGQLNKLEDSRKRIITYRAEDFLRSKTATPDEPQEA